MTQGRRTASASLRRTFSLDRTLTSLILGTMTNRNILGEDLARMLKGGVIMDVVTADQAKIAEDSGACAVMALERVPSDIRTQGGVARMSDPKLIREIQAAVSIPVMAKVRIGHTAEARIVEAVRHWKQIWRELAELKTMHSGALKSFAQEQRVPLTLVERVREEQRLPVVTFVAGGIATPADAALMMSLGCEGVFVGSGIFKSADPPRVAKAIVEATTHWQDSSLLAKVSEGLGALMSGLEVASLETKMQERGW